MQGIISSPMMQPSSLKDSGKQDGKTNFIPLQNTFKNFKYGEI